MENSQKVKTSEYKKLNVPKMNYIDGDVETFTSILDPETIRNMKLLPRPIPGKEYEDEEEEEAQRLLKL
jgi:hypothetical protein